MWLSILPLALIFPLVTLKLIEDKCPEHFTCLQRDNDRLQHLKINANLPNWYELCNCDSYCHLFGDCCSDAPILDQINLEQWAFARVRFSPKINFMSLMKYKCPNDWKGNDIIKSHCENSSLISTYDYLLPEIEHLLLDSEEEFKNWHVTSYETLITYRNVYCSICNNDTKTDAWNKRLMCHNGKCTTVFYQIAPEILGKEKLKRIPLQNKVYSGCNLGWYKMNYLKDKNNVSEILKKCLIFYEPVVAKDSRTNKYIVFKNKFCAQCNYYEESLIECPSSSVDQSTQIAATFNLFTNFDTNFSEGSLINGAENKRCEPRMIYNPINNVCEEIYLNINDINKIFLLQSKNSVVIVRGVPLIFILIIIFIFILTSN